MSQTITLNRGIMTPEQIENKIVAIAATVERYRRVEKSAELKELEELKKVVETDAFQRNKKELLERKYKDTEEGKTWSQFAAAKRRLSTRKYLAIAANESLSKKSLFQKTQAWREQLDCVQNYKRLLPIVSDAEWQKRNEFWANAKRWFTTPESKTDARYLELKAMPDLVFYYTQDSKQIAEWESCKTLLDDSLDAASLDKSRWTAGFHYSSKNLKAVHSYVGEQQANNGGKNVHFGGSVMSVELKAERTKAAAWDAKKGFVEKEFDFTGDTVQMADSFAAAEGIFMIKARIEGKAPAAVCLAAGEKSPLIKLAQYDGDRLVHVGIVTEKGSKEICLEGLKKGAWYVFTAVITKNNIKFYIGDQELLSEANPAAGKEWYPQVSTWLPVGNKAGVGKIELDWVKVFSK